MNAWIEQYLCPWTSGSPHSWSTLLPIAEFAHNSWKHDAAKSTPHELLIGIKPQVILKHLESPIPATETCLQNMAETRKRVQLLMTQIQDIKDSRKITEMKVGDQVWLKGKNLALAGHQKLSPKRYGPFAITEHIGPVAYRLDLLTSMKIHNVFHIDLLMPYKETEAYSTLFTRPPPVIEGEEEYEVKVILDVRRHGRKRKLQYLVHWKGYPNSNNLWVDHGNLNAPDLLKEYYSNSTTAGRPTV